MNRFVLLPLTILSCLLTGFSLADSLATGKPSASDPQPNFVILFADDLGYQDLGCFGATAIKTPHLDQMAREGMRFTSFYAQTVCGPSRAALMTGSYPLRVATLRNRVETHPRLHDKEITIAEILKLRGYATAAFGKWDLAGHTQLHYEPTLLPTRQGFDTFFGTPTSNDSVVHLLRDEKVVEKNADMGGLTQRYTDEAIRFIKQNRERPFFVYLAHTMPHVRLAVPKARRGKSAGGLYGDVIEDIDASAGRILKTLKEESSDRPTYVIFTSDNGPWYLGRSPGHLKRIGTHAESHGGKAEPLRGAKTSAWEGGLRVPCIMWAPGRIPRGADCDAVASTMDLLPTLTRLAGGRIPEDRTIDGKDIRDLMHGAPGATSPTLSYFYYLRTRLAAVRMGRWKLHVPRPVDKKWAHYSKETDAIDIPEPLLYDLEADMGESTNVAAANPDVVARLTQEVEKARRDIGDYDRVGERARFFDPQPRRPDISASQKRKK